MVHQTIKANIGAQISDMEVKLQFIQKMNKDEFRDLSTDIKLVTMFEALTEPMINSLTAECKTWKAKLKS